MTYEAPYPLRKLPAHLVNDPVHRWRAETGIELLHREPDRAELERIIANWQLMSAQQKQRSDARSMELFGATNADRIDALRALYVKQASPTPAQAAAGNYKKVHVNWNGLRLAFENMKGSVRKGVDVFGKKWRVKMPADYGYVKGTRGADGDQVDVYMGSRPSSFMVYLINQRNLRTRRFDEHKCVAGCTTKAEAVALYDKGYADGSGPRRRMGVKSMTVPQFKTWLANRAATQKRAQVLNSAATALERASTGRGFNTVQARMNSVASNLSNPAAVVSAIGRVKKLYAQPGSNTEGLLQFERTLNERLQQLSAARRAGFTPPAARLSPSVVPTAPRPVPASKPSPAYLAAVARMRAADATAPSSTELLRRINARQPPAVTTTATASSSLPMRPRPVATDSFDTISKQLSAAGMVSTEDIPLMRPAYEGLSENERKLFDGINDQDIEYWRMRENGAAPTLPLDSAERYAMMQRVFAPINSTIDTANNRYVPQRNYHAQPYGSKLLDIKRPSGLRNYTAINFGFPRQ